MDNKPNKCNIFLNRIIIIKKYDKFRFLGYLWILNLRIK